MSVYIFVEGETEVLALPRLLGSLVGQGTFKTPIPLYGAKFLRKIGKTAAAILGREQDAHVFACPDVAPKQAFESTRWSYQDYAGLQDVLRREVNGELRARVSAKKADRALDRFHAHPFCHDFEVILLACPGPLKKRLGTTSDITKHYRSKPEDQNFDDYPKKVVHRLFRKFAKRKYRAPDDFPRVLEYATAEDVKGMEALCPRLRGFLRDLRGLAGA